MESSGFENQHEECRQNTTRIHWITGCPQAAFLSMNNSGTDAGVNDEY
jgi:hypothetical protein